MLFVHNETKYLLDFEHMNFTGFIEYAKLDLDRFWDIE